MFAPLALNTRDVQYNNQAIVKLQYQHNFSANAYFRLYGYTYYSNYVAAGAVSSWQPVTGFDSGDYELNSHTRGISGSFVDQISSKHLLQAEASYVTATSLRMNNSSMFGGTDGFAVLVNPRDLTSGTCYSVYNQTAQAQLPGGAAVATTCGTGNSVPVAGTSMPGGGVFTPTFASLAGSFGGAPVGTNGEDLSSTTLQGYTCGGGPCSLYTVENGLSGKYNTVTPVFTGASITDEWRPNDRWLFNAGVRFDSYKYEGDNTTGSPARAFWFNAFNHDTCYNTANLTLYDKTTLGIQPTAPCPAPYQALLNADGTPNAFTLLNVPNQTYTYNIVQPRFGVTYQVNPDTVLRASYGKYTEQPSGAYEQYDALSQNLPDQLAQFYPLGFLTPGHEVRPAVSYNADFSFEHHFKGTDMSVKISPFLRQTHDQIENFFLNIKQGFISGLNAGNQTSEGFEFAFQKGSFDRDGFAAQLGFAYTNAFLKFSPLGNGTTVLSPINADIQTYNAYTSYCAGHPGDKRCGTTTNGQTAAACYTASGTADPACLAGDIANPYWNAPAQQLLDPDGKYLPYSTIPGGVGSGVNAYTYPYVASLILQWKHKKLAITPSFQYVAGNRYGAPETMPGIDPAGGCTVGSGALGGDPRYPYGAAGGSPYDATSCAATLAAIPDSYTGHFDALGAFRQPAQFLGHLRISYDISPRMTATVTMANLISTCFGGQQTNFTYYSNKNVCSYGPVDGGVESPVGNVYNPGDNVQQNLRYPYQPIFGTYNDLTSSTLNPFSVYFDLNIWM